MPVLNFNKLRAQNSNTKTGGKTSTKTGGKTSTKTGENLKKETTENQPQQSAHQTPQKWNADKFDKCELLILSEYCYGCINFSVDAPLTSKEKCFCRQKGTNKDVTFKAIPETAKISQCPGRKESTLILNTKNNA